MNTFEEYLRDNLAEGDEFLTMEVRVGRCGELLIDVRSGSEHDAAMLPRTFQVHEAAVVNPMPRPDMAADFDSLRGKVERALERLGAAPTRQNIETLRAEIALAGRKPADPTYS